MSTKRTSVKCVEQKIISSRILNQDIEKVIEIVRDREEEIKPSPCCKLLERTLQNEQKEQGILE